MVSKTWLRVGEYRNNEIGPEVESLATHIDLIYCGGGNRRFYEIATDHGFLYGAQLPDTIYGELHFADQNWKNPRLDQYVTAVAKYRPKMASVLDWERREQLSEVLNWAEEIAPYVETIMIIPKVINGVSLIPRVVGNCPVRLGYSVPTKHGGTPIPYSEFSGWPVHRLGGNPHKQFRLKHFLDVVSIDGNMFQKMATQFNAFYDPQKQTGRGYWPTIEGFDGQKWGDGSDTADAPYEAFRRSCQNIMAMWHDRLQCNPKNYIQLKLP
jgi:hypothetical protein